MRKGFVTIVLGTFVIVAGICMVKARQKRSCYNNPYTWGITGFGLTNKVLGTIAAMSRPLRRISRLR
ncbi:hypothetical protein [Brevibacillus daliensis]|uniref:hypothetical protein n=1 Tax=Brevibacillus daliensis TaxID=2892995 RepID=UPI001E36A704|nr:hypothetical protein [Brevibacillus daliensis]